jgi:Mn-containing catalase
VMRQGERDAGTHGRENPCRSRQSNGRRVKHGTRDALRHLATREVSHTHMFMEALRSMNALDQPLFGDLKPDDTVNLYFNLSSGPGADERGPWNREPTFQYVADPLQNAMQEHGGRTKGSNEMTPPGGMPDRGPATNR